MQKLAMIKSFLAVWLLRIIAALPWRITSNLGMCLGWLLYITPNETKKIVNIQITKCFPKLSKHERQKLVKQSLLNIGRTTFESTHILLNDVQSSLQLIKNVYGLEELQQALNSGKAVICLTSHLGNWELLSHYYGSICHPLTFYRPIKDQQVEKLIRSKRSQSHAQAVPSTKKGILTIMKAVKGGRAVGIPIDPEPSEAAGLFSPFLATTALTSKFAHTLLVNNPTASAFFMHAIKRQDGFFDVQIKSAPQAMYNTDAYTSVSAMNEVLSDYIKQYPSQYLWSMKRLKHRPANEKRWY